MHFQPSRCLMGATSEIMFACDAMCSVHPSFRPHPAVSRFPEKGNFNRVNLSCFLLQSKVSTENPRLSCLKNPSAYTGKDLFHTKRNVSSTLVKRTACILIGPRLVKNEKILKGDLQELTREVRFGPSLIQWRLLSHQR
ncbi:hypothetical protein H4I96_01427 [Botrytis cinerea]